MARPNLFIESFCLLPVRRRFATDFAGVLYTDAPASGEADAIEPVDLVELERRMATVLPGGWRLGRIQAEQPATRNLRYFQVGRGVAKAVTTELTGRRPATYEFRFRAHPPLRLSDLLGHRHSLFR